MLARHGRKAILTALLATALSTPALADDAASTTQQTVLGEAAMELTATQVSPSAVQEGSLTEASGRVPPPEAGLGGPHGGPAAPSAVVPQQPAAAHRSPPLILGIGY